MFSRTSLRRTLLSLLALAACGPSDARPARERTPVSRDVLVDDFGDTLRGSHSPARIVSLNPTTTELLFALGVGDRLVGRTHWDVYPAAAAAVPDLGDGIRPNVEAILAARPDLVVLYASADNRSAADAVTHAGIPVVALKIDRIADFLHAVRLLGAAIGEPARAAITADTVARSLERVRAATAGATRPSVLWPLFAEPLYVIGGGSFMSELVDIAGGRNVFADIAQPSPQVGREEVLRRDADAIIASPTSVRQVLADPAWRNLSAVRAHRVFVEDTALVERPSVRLGEAAASIALLLHPELRDRLTASH